MRVKGIGAVLACMVLLCGLTAVSASALEAGVYTANVTTTYYNPDTGNVDDGGTANAALGEGMCRSATDTTGLVEVDQDGTVWVTIRLLLQSNCKNVAFYARNGYDSYAKVSYTKTAEDSEKDSIDYRFKVSDPGVKLKGTMYVNPMGRDVLWYLYVDTATLKSGSGDFVVSIDLDKKDAPAAEPVQSGDSTKNTSGGQEETTAKAEENKTPAAEQPKENEVPAGEVPKEEHPQQIQDGAEPAQEPAAGDQSGEQAEPSPAGSCLTACSWPMTSGWQPSTTCGSPGSLWPCWGARPCPARDCCSRRC